MESVQWVVYDGTESRVAVRPLLRADELNPAKKPRNMLVLGGWTKSRHAVTGERLFEGLIRDETRKRPTLLPHRRWRNWAVGVLFVDPGGVISSWARRERCSYQLAAVP